jgi:hypothetical protein
MTQSKNVSPVGWYVGSYLLRFVELEKITIPTSRFLTWENTTIVKARTLNEAYDKVVRIAQGHTKPYKGGIKGVPVRWLFEGLTELLPIYEKLEDGSEIMWAEHSPRTLKNIRSSGKTKKQFHQKWCGCVDR